MNCLKTCFCCILICCTALLIAQEDQQLKQLGFPTSSLEFESTIFNYGTIESGEVVQTIFTFTNTGTEPIVIANAKGSCGCTVPEWPKEPIAAGETGQFVVRFNSKNKVGMQSKRVTISANTDPANTYLTVTGEVIKAEEIETEDVVKAEAVRLGDIDASDVILYPNPTSEILYVSVHNIESYPADVYVYNSTGQLIDSKKINAPDQGDITFDVSQYISGLYTVSIKAANLNRIAKQVSIVTE